MSGKHELDHQFERMDTARYVNLSNIPKGYWTPIPSLLVFPWHLIGGGANGFDVDTGFTQKVYSQYASFYSDWENAESDM